MKVLSIAICITICQILNAQTREFIVLDAQTGEPISHANVYYPKLNEGSTSNLEGKVLVNLRPDTLYFSHINYAPKRLTPGSVAGASPIYLQPTSIELEEVVFHRFDLIEKLEYVLSNYDDLYVTNRSIHTCTFKESFWVNEKLTRLFQIQLHWWSRRYRSFQPISKHNSLSLLQVDYSKRDTVFPNTGSIIIEYLFRTLHLDYHLMHLLRWSSADIDVQSVERRPNDTKVTFNATIVQNNDTVSFWRESTIFFDNSTGAITNLNIPLYFNNIVGHRTTPQGNPTLVRMKRDDFELSFRKLHSGLFTLGHYRFESNATVTYDDITDTLCTSYEMFVHNTASRRIRPLTEVLDLDSKHFYDNIPIKPSDSKAIMLLNAEEKNFLKRDMYNGDN